MGMTPLLQAHHAMERMEEFVHKMWEGRWRVIPHDVLPDWLKDNDYLLHGHRPPMPSFRACFRSIFRIHTETGNIWTHLLGMTHTHTHTHTFRACFRSIFRIHTETGNIWTHLLEQ